MLQHEWLQDCAKEGEINIFNNVEQLSMLREFVYLEKEEDW